MISTEEVKALVEQDEDVVALIMSIEKIAELHELIGKVRHLIQTLPDKDTVLKVDFEVQILSQNNYEYQTDLKVGRLRTRIDAVCENKGISIQFWPMWNDEDVVFESLGAERIEQFVAQWNESI
ncbi:MAG: hypothetical protein CMK59_15030 [Proteobacteria bacterium]|nr:hypothetical protein [Pseudomonadota bacterium]